MAIDVRRLVELGMVPELAKELASQIDAEVGGAVAAADVSFDPADAPGITATNVQEALEELATLVDGA